jgi:hypothetical protein
MNIYDDYCWDQITSIKTGRQACSNNFGRQPGEGRQKSIDELLGTLQFSFTWDTYFSAFPGTWEQRVVVMEPI